MAQWEVTAATGNKVESSTIEAECAYVDTHGNLVLADIANNPSRVVQIIRVDYWRSVKRIESEIKAPPG
jgi:hypothetical protein